MAPAATTDLPPTSALEEILVASKSNLDKSPHAAHFHHVATTIAHDLQYQHYWTSILVHTHSPINKQPLPRPIISGLPPKRAYIHPDEQVEILKAEHKTGEKIEQLPEREWVLPAQLQEKMSLGKFAAVFDALTTVPPSTEESVEEGDDEEEERVGYQWQGSNRQKRILLATLGDDSTVVYYIMHEGIIKPRQN